LELHYWRSCPT